MEETFVCCFCAQPIERQDQAAVHIAITNLWAADAAQGLQSHAGCIRRRVQPTVPFEPEALTDQLA